MSGFNLRSVTGRRCPNIGSNGAKRPLLLTPLEPRRKDSLRLGSICNVSGAEDASNIGSNGAKRPLLATPFEPRRKESLRLGSICDLSGANDAPT